MYYLLKEKNKDSLELELIKKTSCSLDYAINCAKKISNMLKTNIYVKQDHTLGYMGVAFIRYEGSVKGRRHRKHLRQKEKIQTKNELET